MAEVHDAAPREAPSDEADLERFGYKQELRRTLGVFSSFAVAFTYISPSTGIFTLFFLGLTTVGGVFIWSWPIVAAGQLIVALGFAELASHYPVAGSVFQWTKYLSGKTYSWFAGWIYLFAGIITVASVCATLPLALIPAFNNMGWNLANNHTNQRTIAVITLALITVLNIFGVRLVALINNTGVMFEILGMVVFAFILAIFHHHQSASVIFHTGGTSLTTGSFLIAMFMSLYVIYGFDTAGTLAEETRDPRREAPKAIIASVIGAFVIGAVFLYAAAGDPQPLRGDQGRLGAGADHRRELRERVLDGVPARGLGGDLRLLSRDPDGDDSAVLRDVARRPPAGLERPPQGTSGLAHTHRLLHSDRRPRVHPDAPICRRGDSRDCGDRNDLPELPDREPGSPARAPARMAAIEGPVFPGSMGTPAQHCGPPVRWCDAPQYRLASRRPLAHQSDSESRSRRQRPSAAQLRLELAERPAGALDRRRRPDDCRRDLLRARPAAQAGASAGAGGRGLRRRRSAYVRQGRPNE